MYCVILALLFCLLTQNKVLKKYDSGLFLQANKLSLKKPFSSKKDTYFATLIHDLKTPIYSQIRAIKIMLSGVLGELTSDQKKILKEILYSELYMADIVSNILTAYKYDSSELKLIKTNFDISAELNNIYESLKILAEEKLQRIQVNYRCTTLETYGDRLQLVRVMTNLISNAIKYGKYKSEIIVELENTNGIINFSVKDCGDAIPPNKLNKIFDKYSGGMNHYNSASTGLGLYLSKKIIQMHGGHIFAKSENGINEFGFSINCNNFIQANAPLAK